VPRRPHTRLSTPTAFFTDDEMGGFLPPRWSSVMPHAFRVGQLVALAQTSRNLEPYEVVQLMPETPSGEPQYRIKGLSSGMVRAVREAEIQPHP